jgi:hypothetical protein
LRLSCPSQVVEALLEPENVVSLLWGASGRSYSGGHPSSKTFYVFGVT